MFFNDNKKKYVQSIIKKYLGKKEIYTNEKGFKINERDKRKIDKYIDKINKNNEARFSEIKNQKIKVNGIETGWTFQDRLNAEKIRMGEVYSTRYGAFKVPVKSAIDNITDKHQLQTYIKNLKKRSSKRTQEKRLNQYKENYIQSIVNQFGKTENTDKLVERIKRYSPKQIDRMMLEDDRVYIRYVYSKTEEKVKIMEIMSAFNLHYE